MKKVIHTFLNHQTISGNQAKASRLLGVSPQNVSNWKRKDTTTDMPAHLFPKAAESLGMKPSELIALVFE